MTFTKEFKKDNKTRKLKFTGFYICDKCRQAFKKRKSHYLDMEMKRKCK